VSSRFVLIRHGWVDWSQVSGRGWRGHLVDLAPLSAAGVERMESVVERVVAHRPSAIVSSPLTRAMQSAHVLAGHLGLPLRVDLDLREWSCDLVDGWSAERSAVAQEELRRHDGEPPPGSSWEALSAVRDRVLGALRRYGERDTVVVVTHNVVIYALTGLDVPPGAVVPWDGIPRRWQDLGAARATAAEVRRLRSPGPLPAVYQLPGPVDVPALDRALTGLAARHEVLRTRFRVDAGEVVRQVLPDGDVICAVHPAGTDAAELARPPLDPHGWPLLRAQVVLGDPARLALTVDRLVVDPWSEVVLAWELARRYEAELAAEPVVLPDLPVEHRQQEPWPVDPPASVDGAREERRLLLDHVAWRRLAARCRREGAEPLAGLVAAVAAAVAEPVRVLEFSPERSAADRHVVGWLASSRTSLWRLPATVDLPDALRSTAPPTRARQTVVSFVDERGLSGGWPRIGHRVGLGDYDVRFERTPAGLSVSCVAVAPEPVVAALCSVVRRWAV